MNDTYYILYVTKSGRKGWIRRHFLCQGHADQWAMEQYFQKKWDHYRVIKSQE